MANNLSGFVKSIRDIMRNDAGINGDAQRIEQIAWMLFLKVYDAQEQNWEMDEDDFESIIPDDCKWSNWAQNDNLTGEELLNFVNNKLFPTLKKLDVNKYTPIKKAIVKTTFEDANNYMKDGVLLRQVINIIDGLVFVTMRKVTLLVKFMSQFLRNFKVLDLQVNFIRLELLRIL